MSEIAIGAAAPPRARTAGGWIVSAPFDTALLIFVPLLTLPVVFIYVRHVPIFGIAAGIILAFAHYMSSASFLFWEESRDYHRMRWLAFYVGPFLLAGVYLLLIAYRVPFIIQFVLIFWNTFHVARQNCGVVSIYRNRAGVRDPMQKDAANRAIIAASAFLTLWNINSNADVMALFNKVSANFADFVRFALGVIAVIAIAGLVRALWIRRRSGQAVPLPELLLLATSIAFFYPYLFIQSSEVATGAMLIPHYVQYMALVWLVHRRKFGQPGSTGAPYLLKRVSTSLAVLVPFLFVIGFAFYSLFRISSHFSFIQQFEILYLLIAFEHFYFDGLIWSFKQKHVRDTIGPYLMRPAAIG